MNVTRSIVYGVVGPCKTESSQKPVPVHPVLADALIMWKTHSTYTKPNDWVFASKRHRGRKPYWGRAILRKYIRPVALRGGIQKRFGWPHVSTHILNSFAKCRDRVQANARAAAAFHLAINFGRLHAGSRAGETRSASGRCGAALFI